jgi:hypothetical protein
LVDGILTYLSTGNRSLLKNLDPSASASEDAARYQTDTTSEEDDEDDIPEQLETVIDILLNGLRDKV